MVKLERPNPELNKAGKIFCKIGEYLLKLALVITLALYTYSLLILPIGLMNVTGVVDGSWVIVLYGFLAGLIILAWRNPTSRAGLLMAAGPLLYAVWLVNEHILGPRLYRDFPLLGMLSFIVMGLDAGVACSALIVVLVKSFKIDQDRVSILGGVLVILSGPLGIFLATTVKLPNPVPDYWALPNYISGIALIVFGTWLGFKGTKPVSIVLHALGAFSAIWCAVPFSMELYERDGITGVYGAMLGAIGGGIALACGAFATYQMTARTRIGESYKANRIVAASKLALQKARPVIKHQRAIATIGLILAISCGSYFGIGLMSFPRGQITITPPNYHVQFAFWAILDPRNYSKAELESLNFYGAILVGGAPIDPENPANASINLFVNQTRWYLMNYPNVHFSITCSSGLASGICDATAKQTTDDCKLIINIVKNYSLTNIIGETLDWEGYSPSNATLHQQAVDIWNSFLDWKEANAPAGFRITLLANPWLYYDHLDGNYDQHVERQAIDYQVPRFDEYCGSIYRCYYSGAKPYGDPVTQSSSGGLYDSYDVYEGMVATANTITGTFGNLDKLGVYLGETNCSCYGNNTKVYENGKYMGTGWDSVVRDTLICKSFGPKVITYFLLFNAPTGDGWIMGGMFASYGEDFLKRLDTAVNGPNSTKPITIDIGPVHVDQSAIPDLYAMEYMNFIYDLNYPTWFGIAVGIIVALALVAFVSTWRSRPDADDSTGEIEYPSKASNTRIEDI